MVSVLVSHGEVVRIWPEALQPLTCRNGYVKVKVSLLLEAVMLEARHPLLQLEN